MVVRHAKSDWNTGAADKDRPLNSRGRKDASAVGRWIAEQGLSVDAAVVSPAVRTRATWDLMAQEAGLAVRPEFVPGIYLGEIDDLALAVREAPAKARCLVLVGHSPGSHELVEWMCDGVGDPGAVSAMRAKFPTAAVAQVSVEGPWANLAAGCGRLVAFTVCRG